MNEVTISCSQYIQNHPYLKSSSKLVSFLDTNSVSQRDRKSQYHQGQSSAMIHINTLPQEIIVMILREVYRPSITNTELPLQTLIICRQWRKITIEVLKIGTPLIHRDYWVEKEKQNAKFWKELVVANPGLVRVALGIRRGEEARARRGETHAKRSGV